MNENIKKAIHDIIEKLQAERDPNQSAMRARDVYLSENAKGLTVAWPMPCLCCCLMR